jgi:hypothetical protein
MKKLLLMIACAALVIGPTGHLSAAERLTACGLTGKANFKPGITLVPDTYKVTFTGKLADCQSTGKVKSANVRAVATADASCELGTVEGKSTIVWDTGKKTVVKFSTVDVGASVTLTGQVTKSSESSFKKNDNILGQLAFEADATQCTSGLKSAKFTGEVFGGSPS